MKQKIFFSVVICIIIFAICLVFSCKSEMKSTSQVEAPEGMVWIEGKTFIQGAKDDDRFAMQRESPAHKVNVDGFFIDVTEVTNKQFKKFVEETGYITVAERPITWEDLKKDVPAGTPKPHDSVLQPGSLIFNKNVNAVVNMQNYGQWWTWKIGANWKHPQGPESSIEGQDNYPVVHIAYEDAITYCKWVNRRLPTESEWESAAQGNLDNAIYTWGNDFDQLTKKANTWQGIFPTVNNPEDGFQYISPVKSYESNSIGIYDMAGNVWEITSDYFNSNYYNSLNTHEIIDNPKGANRAYNPDNPYIQEYIIKGGSFLCHESYCASFRISARMGFSPDSGSDHIGFRTVATRDMIQ
jgi:formylglycine-generating enzyme required for sulfatase activity